MKQFLLALAILLPVTAVASEPATVALSLRDHRFTPSTVVVPAGVRVRIEVTNFDTTAEEFESAALGAEKVVAAGHHASVLVGPLAPGSYAFGGEYDPNAAGTLVAK